MCSEGPESHQRARAAYQDSSCIIFDFDGVLASSEEVHSELWGQLLPSAGSDHTTYQAAKIAGVEDHVLVERFLPHNKELHDEILHRKKQLYRSRIHEIAPVPGSRKLLAQSAETKQFFICSGAETELIRKFVRKHFPNITFELIVGRGDYVHCKPDPEPYNVLLRKAGLNKKEVLAIEDSHPGIEAATAAGLEAIHLDRYRLGCLGKPRILTLHSLIT